MDQPPGGQGNVKPSILAREKRKQNVNSLTELRDIIKHNNIGIIGITEEEEREMGAKHLFEKIIAENFPNLVKKAEIKNQKAQRAPTKSTHGGPHEDTVMKVTKCRDKREF